MEHINTALIQLGFRVNTKKINGYIPHFTKEGAVLFVITKNFWISKIVKIAHKFKGSGLKVYGILLESAPRLAERDWISGEKDNQYLIRLNPLQIGKWSSDNNKIEYKNIDLLP